MSNRTETVTARVSAATKSKVETAAKSRGISQSSLVGGLLESQLGEPLPLVAALGCIIAIHARVSRDDSQPAEVINELRVLVEELALFAHRELSS